MMHSDEKRKKQVFKLERKISCDMIRHDDDKIKVNKNKLKAK